MPRATKEEFIIKARKVHGDWYDYSKVDYQGNKKPVIIGCPEHGDFPQRPDSHLHSGCKKCGYKRNGENSRKTKEEFIEHAQILYGNWYDYSKVVYVKNKIHVIIGCPDHGDFEQRPNDHLSGYGCNYCGIETNRKRLTRTTESFIKIAKEVYANDRFDYSLVDYKGCMEPVKIIDTLSNEEFEVAPIKFLSVKMCECCRVIASYGFKDEKGTRCFTHRLRNQINVVVKKCETEKCSCLRAIDNLCKNCYYKLHPDKKSTREKVKEDFVIKFVEEHFNYYNIMYNKKIVGGLSNSRPDIIIDMGTHFIIIEIDEKQHCSYDVMEERLREIDIQKDLDKPVVFIRFNPDGYTKNGIYNRSSWKLKIGGTVLCDEGEFNSRLDSLKEWIEYYTKTIPEKDLKHQYLFYNKPRTNIIEN